MHFSTLSQLIRSESWTKNRAKRNILRNVERAGSLAWNDEQETGPFGLMASLCVGRRGEVMP